MKDPNLHRDTIESLTPLEVLGWYGVWSFGPPPINDFDWLKEQFNENRTIAELVPNKEPYLDNEIVDLLDRFQLLYQGR